MFFFRYDIKNKNNLEVVDILIKVINDNVSNDKMCRMILDKMPMWNEQLVVEGDNRKEVFDNKSRKLFVIEALELLKDKLLFREYEMAYDIADILQGLPDIVISNKKEGFRQYWKLYVKPFQKKWNLNIFNEFLDKNIKT